MYHARLMMRSRHIQVYLYTVHCVPKKEAIKLLAITFSNLNRFSKFFHCWKGDEISNYSLQMISDSIMRKGSKIVLSTRQKPGLEMAPDEADK